ncbi:transposase [Acetobacter ghanensis]|uniref:Transposase n=1 Tax=Acetobacter ghanensis TaxID=431306 RepID=A0A0U5BNI7_9PROT|nr:transposase [Acetobacter ghanensis]NHO40470.1 transposase [Acetobacter ghanensis]GBQ48050.1 transposase [Acetobacter ghanensis DSM 18895]CEF57499.1 transposase [Acetobacter ghanensis]
MEEEDGTGSFTDETWAIWEPLIEAVRPRGKTPPHDLRRTIAAIFWRHENGAKWRSIPAIPLWVVADKGYASNAFRERIWDMGARPAIPVNRRDGAVACQKRAYRCRHLVENLWARLKEWRAVATRYEKTAASFLAVIHIAAAADGIKP